MSTVAYQLDVPFLAQADAEARDLTHPYIAPEHLFIALAAHGTGACRRFFDEVRLDADAIRAAVRDLVGAPRSPASEAGEPLRLAHRAQIAIAAPLDDAHVSRHADTAYTADDLLASLLSDRVALPAVVGAILSRVGLTPATARAKLASLAATAS